MPLSADPREVLAAGFRAASALRGGRALHPNGLAFEAVLHFRGAAPTPDASPAGAVELFGRAGPVPAIVRLSRSIGLPEPLPDLHGAALRVPDAYGLGLHQDLLFATGASSALARHLFVPTLGFAQCAMSTLAPYTVGNRKVVFLLSADPGCGPLRRLAELPRIARDGRLTFTLLEAPAISGRLRMLGRLEVGEQLSAEAEEQLRFNPANSGGGLEPATLINWLRPPSYQASEAERELTEAR